MYCKTCVTLVTVPPNPLSSAANDSSPVHSPRCSLDLASRKVQASATMRKQHAKAKGVHSHHEKSSMPEDDSSPATPSLATATDLKRTLPAHIETIGSHRKKRSINNAAEKAKTENKQSVRSPTSDKHPLQHGNSSNDAHPPSLGTLKDRLAEEPQNGNSNSPSALNGIKKLTDAKASEAVVKHPRSAIPSEVQQLTTEYQFTPISVISSSKLEQKIRNVIERVSTSSLVEAKASPGVVILHAEAKNANKMVTIAELAKRDIEKNKGSWWQYTKLEGQVMELTEKPRKSPLLQGAEMLVNGPAEQRNAADSVNQIDVDMEGIGEDPTTNGQPKHVGSTVISAEDEEQEEAFETMSAPTTARREPARKKVRAVPIMTIYLARVPVSGLRELYG